MATTPWMAWTVSRPALRGTLRVRNRHRASTVVEPGVRSNSKADMVAHVFRAATLIRFTRSAGTVTMSLSLRVRIVEVVERKEY
jgi:hypothetical protein